MTELLRETLPIWAIDLMLNTAAIQIVVTASILALSVFNGAIKRKPSQGVREKKAKDDRRFDCLVEHLKEEKKK